MLHVAVLIANLEGRKMLKKILLVAVTTGLAAKGVQVLLQRAAKDRHALRKQEKTTAVQDWENEGGPAIQR
jgi:hypothetical protein